MVAGTCSQNVKPTYATCTTVRNLKQLSCMRPKCFYWTSDQMGYIGSRFVRWKLMGFNEMGSEGILLQVI